jgi:hypothetical protein
MLTLIILTLLNTEEYFVITIEYDAWSDVYRSVVRMPNMQC